MKVIWCKHNRLTFYDKGNIVTGCDVCERKITVRKFLRSEYEKIKETSLSDEEEAAKPTGWRNIRNDQPPQNQEVLVYDCKKKAVMIAILEVYTLRPTDRLGQPCQIGSNIITHWMPLPPAP